MANKEMKDWMDNFEKLSGQKIVNKDELNVLDDGTVETLQELKSDRDRLHNIYIQQTIEINKLKGELNNALREVNALKRDELELLTAVNKSLSTK